MVVSFELFVSEEQRGLRVEIARPLFVAIDDLLQT
jgi:hypothetical protein